MGTGFHIALTLLHREAACGCKWWAVTLLPKAGPQRCFPVLRGVWREPSRRPGRVENLLEGLAREGKEPSAIFVWGEATPPNKGLRCSGLQGGSRCPLPVPPKLWQNQEPGCQPKGPGGLCGIQPPGNCRPLGNREESWSNGFVLSGASSQEGEICF